MRSLGFAILGATLWMTVMLVGPVAAQAPPDVVELRNGGMVRGTLIENIPGDHVTIQIATGEVRTFSAAEVLRVGAAPVAPVMTPVVVEPGYPSGTSIPQPPTPMVRVRVEGTSEELSLHRLTGTASVSVWTGRGVGTAAIDQFAIVCGAPCEQQLPAGRADHSIFHLDHDATLELEYESREGIRIGGWVLFGVASLGYALGATLPLLTSSTDQFLEILLISTGIYLALCIPVIVMVALNDHADVREITDILTQGVRF
jgi:hypothetical protein